LLKKPKQEFEILFIDQMGQAQPIARQFAYSPKQALYLFYQNSGAHQLNCIRERLIARLKTTTVCQK